MTSSHKGNGGPLGDVCLLPGVVQQHAFLKKNNCSQRWKQYGIKSCFIDTQQKNKERIRIGRGQTSLIFSLVLRIFLPLVQTHHWPFKLTEVAGISKGWMSHSRMKLCRNVSSPTALSLTHTHTRARSIKPQGRLSSRIVPQSKNWPLDLSPAASMTKRPWVREDPKHVSICVYECDFEKSVMRVCGLNPSFIIKKVTLGGPRWDSTISGPPIDKWGMCPVLDCWPVHGVILTSALATGRDNNTPMTMLMMDCMSDDLRL